eukprot:m.975434 g.975434  ORF g.975434 m.975434 type:complete len:1130 (+) comp23940_c0_seq1:108-3497(+)
MPVRTQKQTAGAGKKPPGVSAQRGTSPSKVQATRTQPPPPPTSLSLVDVSACSITAHWVAPVLPVIPLDNDGSKGTSAVEKQGVSDDSCQKGGTDAAGDIVPDTPAVIHKEPVVEYDVRFEGRDRNGGKAGGVEVGRTSKLEFQATDLQPGTVYTFSVRTVRDGGSTGGNSTGGESAYTAQVSTTTLCTAPPEPPSRVSLGNRKKTSLSLKWGPPKKDGGKTIDTYTVLWDGGKETTADGKADDIAITDLTELYTGPEKKFKIDLVLKPASPYRFAMCCTNELGRSPYTPITTFYTAAGPPSSPDPPTLVSASVDTLHLRWHPPAETNGAEVSEYTLEMNGEYGFRPLYCGSKCEHVVDKLTRASEYEFRLVARNSAGLSKPSAKAIISTSPDLPGAVPKPAAVNSTATAVTISYRAGDDGGADIVGFVVELAGQHAGICATTKTNAFPKDTPFVQIYAGPLREYTLEGLDGGCAYMCRVASFNRMGRGPFSSATRVVTQPVAPAPPPPPLVKQGSGETAATELHIHWNAPASLGGAPVHSYKLVSALTPMGTDRLPDPAALQWMELYEGALHDFILTGLDPAHTYAFRVQARNSAGWSAFSAVATGLTSAAAPKAPTNVRVDPAVSPGPTSLGVVWDAPAACGQPIEQYIVDYRMASAASVFQALSVKGSKCAALLVGLTPATAYSVRVKAVNAMGISDCSAEVQHGFQTCPAVPSAPPDLKVVSVDEHSVSIAWGEPADNGSRIQAYSLQVNGKKIASLPKATLSAKEHTLRDLEPSTTYKFRIQAINSVGNGPFGSPVSALTKLVPPSGPIIDVVSASTSALKIKWATPSDSKAAAIETSIEIRDQLGFFDEVYSGTGKTFKISKLQPSTTYEIRGRSFNSAGAGLYGPPAFLTTVEAPLEIPTALQLHVTHGEDNSTAAGSTNDRCADGNTCALSIEWRCACMNTRAQVYEVQLHHRQLRGRKAAVAAGKEDTLTCTIVDEDDETIASAVVKPQFDTIYTGLETRVTVQGLFKGYQYLARVRIRDTKEGGRIGTFSDVTQVKIPAKVAKSASPPAEKDGSSANIQAPASTDKSISAPPAHFDVHALKQRLSDMDIDDALTWASENLHILIALAAVFVALFIRLVF